MGFFSDLKQDLSQAVNEMVPDESSEKKVNTQEEVFEEVNVEETISSSNDISDLEAMLDKLDDTMEEDAEETDDVVSMPASQQEAGPAIPIKDYVIPEPAQEKVERRTESLPEAKNTTKVALDETGVITAGMRIDGNISSAGSLDVLGIINGDIDVLGKLNITGDIQGNSKASEIYAEKAKITGEIRSAGAAKIGQSTVIIGNLFASSAVIAGAIKGDIDVKGPVILETTAIVMGNIKSKSVQINNGAVIEGMCSQTYAEVNPTRFFDEIKTKKGK